MTESGPIAFEVQTEDHHSSARCGRLRTPHGSIRTPAFMPVGTLANVKGLLPDQVAATGADIILANTYHLELRPGSELIKELGGLHQFMNWPGPILTDSGGFQVFSLAHRRKIHEDAVVFNNHIDGSEMRLGPKEAMQIQVNLGSDIIMSFDECIPFPVEHSYAEASVARTTRWEKETLNYHPRDGRGLFGIVQGGVFADLRQRSAEDLLALDFDGYAMGGLFIGEKREDAMAMIELTASLIPKHYPRYVMGVGTPMEVIDAVGLGWDMFDCVLPTRNARHGTAMTMQGKLRLKNARFKQDKQPIEEDCPCLACTQFSRAYIRHLISANEILAATLVSHHNLSFMSRMMAGLRQAIANNQFAAYRSEIAAAWPEAD